MQNMLRTNNCKILDIPRQRNVDVINNQNIHLVLKHVGRMVLTGNEGWAYLSPHPLNPHHPTLLAGPRSHFILNPFGNYL